MNISQLSEQLKDVPQGTLIGYAKNPNSVVPQFLALAEIQRRQQLQAPTEAPSSTVANDVLTQATAPQMPPQMAQGQPQQMPQGQPQQPPQQAQQLPENQPGVAQLPTGMGKGFANGGIVAFASGDLIEDETDDDREMAQLFPESSMSMEDLQALSQKAGSGIRSLASNLPQSYEATKAAQKAAPSDGLSTLISSAASKHNVPAEYLNRIAGIESSGNPNAANKLSSSKGLFGFTDKTWQAVGGKQGEQTDPEKSADLAALHSRQNAEGLKSHLGRNPTYGETYTAHHFGLSGAKHLLGMDPKTPMEKAVSPLVLKQNPQLQGKTVGQVLSNLSGKTGEGIVALAAGGHIPKYSGTTLDESLVENVPEVNAGNKLLSDYLADEEKRNAPYKADIARENARLLEKAPAPSTKELARQQLGIEETGIPRLLSNANKSLTSSLAQYQPNINDVAPEASSNQPSGITNYLRSLVNSVSQSDGSQVTPAAAVAAPNRVSQGAVANRDPYRSAPASAAPSAPAVAPPLNAFQENAPNTQNMEDQESNKHAVIPRIETSGTAPFAPQAEIKSTTSLYEEALAKSIEDQAAALAKQGHINAAMSVLNAGFGMMKSRSPYMLGGIGEGAQEGVSTYASLKKQEADQLKDINAMRLGLYKYGAAKDTSAASLAETKRGHDLAYGAKGDAGELRNIGLYEQAYTKEEKAIDAKAAAHLKSLGLETLPPELQLQYDAQKQQAKEQLRKLHNLPPEPTVQYKPITAAMPKLNPTVKQRLPESMGGLSAADMKAIEWANKNPYDPKAWEVKNRLGL